MQEPRLLAPVAFRENPVLSRSDSEIDRLFRRPVAENNCSTTTGDVWIIANWLGTNNRNDLTIRCDLKRESAHERIRHCADCTIGRRGASAEKSGDAHGQKRKQF